MTHALHYGTGCFEGIRGYWNDDDKELLLLQPLAHFQRMEQSARILTLDLPHTAAELVDITRELVRRNAYAQDCYVRPLLFKSGQGIGLPFAEVPTSFAIWTTPFGKYLDTERGIRCRVSSWQRVSDAAVPVRAKVTGGYINSNLIKAEAVRDGFDEAIVLDRSGHVSEGSAENLFMLRKGKAFTPPPSSDLLEGITRRLLMQLLREDMGVEVVERLIDRSELYVCDELFLCGTGGEIAPVVEVDRRPVAGGAIGETTRALQRLYFDSVRGRLPHRRNWLTPV